MALGFTLNLERELLHALKLEDSLVWEVESIDY